MAQDEISKPFKGVILFPVHVWINFTIKANRYFIFCKALCNAGSASMRMVYGVAAALMVNTGTEGNFHLNDLLKCRDLTFILKIYSVNKCFYLYLSCMMVAIVIITYICQ